jgi:hypothetical protein
MGAGPDQPRAQNGQRLRARDLTVTLPPGSPQAAQREPVTVKSRLVRMLVAPEHVTAAGRLPGKAVLTFHVGYVTGKPFLAWLDNGQWVAVPSTYNARAGHGHMDHLEDQSVDQQRDPEDLRPRNSNRPELRPGERGAGD